MFGRYVGLCSVFMCIYTRVYVCVGVSLCIYPCMLRSTSGYKWRHKKVAGEIMPESVLQYFKLIKQISSLQNQLVHIVIQSNAINCYLKMLYKCCCLCTDFEVIQV